MFEQYTERAARVLKQAGKVSKELGQNYVGTEHILIAILRDAGCAAAQLLAERKVEEKAVLELIRDLISPEGNVAVADRRVAFNQQINAIVPNEDEVLYLYWLMLLSKPAIHRAINMALKGILSKRQLSEMMFPFPPVALQKQFVTFVEQTDKSKLAIQESLKRLEILKKSLMQKYFG